MLDRVFDWLARRLSKRVAQEITPEMMAQVHGLVRRTHENGTPVTNAMTELLRDVAVLRWSTKVLAAKLTTDLYTRGKAGPAAPIPAAPVHVGLRSKVCNQSDFESDWFRYWCGQLKETPTYSRTLWEWVFVLQALFEADLLQPGRRGLGFAVGTEPLSSYLASRRLEILATDLDSSDARMAGWQSTWSGEQRLDPLLKPELIGTDEFRARCRFRPIDMNDVPTDLHGQFDFCWSVCSFEHLGAIEKGLAFIETSVRCLKPGGVAVHSTELCLDGSDETIDNWPTVLFRRKDIERLGERLAAAGHQLVPVDFQTGQDFLDLFIDVPPYPWQQHVRLSYPPKAPSIRVSIDGFASTSIGLIVKAAT